jgi:hypothetical protein
MPRQFATDEQLDYVAALLDDMFRIRVRYSRKGVVCLKTARVRTFAAS